MTLNLNHSTIVEDLEFNLSKARRHLHLSFRIPTISTGFCLKIMVIY